MTPTPDLVGDYLTTLGRAIQQTTVTDAQADVVALGDGVAAFIGRARAIHDAGGKLIFVGNGASASMASHFALDFTKNGRLRSLAVNDGPMLTALVNDIGAEAMFAEQLDFYARPEDALVAISSSGASPNILAAVERARGLGLAVFTFSGFSSANPLRAAGDLNFWVDQDEYGFVEVAHTALLHTILDLSLGWGTEDDRNPGALKKAKQPLSAAR